MEYIGGGILLKLFQLCFVTGVLFSVVSFLLGRISDFSHMGADTGVDTHIDHGFHGDFHSDTGIDAGIDSAGGYSELPVSPLKPAVIAVFVTVFGGVGLICNMNGLSSAASMLISLASGMAASCFVYFCVIVPLYRAQNTNTVSRKTLRGSIARVSLPIRGEAFGKITYTAGGNTCSAPAKSADGKDIEGGDHVVIVNIERNTFLVKKIKGGQ